MERIVPLTGFMADRLRARLEGRGGDVVVFPSERGHHLRSNNFKTREYDPAVEAARLRKGSGSMISATPLRPPAVHSGASVKSVQRMLGHASAALTLDIYSGLFDQELNDVADRMDGLLKPESPPDPP